MEKFKVKSLSVSIDTNLNEKGELFNKLYVNFEEGKDYYRKGEFLSFSEKKLLKMKYPQLDFETIQNVSVSDLVVSVECCKDKTKWAEVFYLLVNLGVSYSVKISIEGADFEYIKQMYRILNEVNVSSNNSPTPITKETTKTK